MSSLSRKEALQFKLSRVTRDLEAARVVVGKLRPQQNILLKKLAELDENPGPLRRELKKYRGPVLPQAPVGSPEAALSAKEQFVLRKRRESLQRQATDLQHWESQIPEIAKLVQDGTWTQAQIREKTGVTTELLSSGLKTNPVLQAAAANRWLPKLGVFYLEFLRINNGHLKDTISPAYSYNRLKYWVTRVIKKPWALNLSEWWQPWEDSGMWVEDPNARTHCIVPIDLEKGWVVGNLKIVPRWASFEQAGQVAVKSRWTEPLTENIYLQLSPAEFQMLNSQTAFHNKSKTELIRYYLSLILNYQMEIPQIELEIAGRKGGKEGRAKRHSVRAYVTQADYRRI